MEARQTTVVTGAASGIGAAVATALIRDGGRVVAIDIDADRLTRGAQIHGDRFIPRALDVTDVAAIETVIAEVEATSEIDGLVNAAGVLLVGSALTELDMPAFERAMAVNAAAPWLVSRAVAKAMIERRRGAIVTVSSNASAVPRVDLGVYAATKAAATALTRSLGLELAPFGIRCNVVSPGSTNTPMLTRLLDGRATDSSIAGDPSRFRLGIPLGRVADASDVADGIVFLLSDRARHITLHDLRIDGGATL